MEEDDKTAAAIGWLLDSPPNSDGVDVLVIDEDETEVAATVWLLVSAPYRAGVVLFVLEVETEATTEWLLV